MMKLYQISDCHLSLTDKQIEANLIRVLQHIEGQGDGDMLLITGDLVSEPSVEVYMKFKAVIEAHVTIDQIYAIAGNHDDLSLMQRVFHHSKIRIQPKVKLINGIWLLMLDSSLKPITGMPLGAGRVSKQALAQLKKETRKHPSVVIVHHPVLNVGAQWFAHIGIENHQAVIDAVHPQTLAVISGHAHRYFLENIKGSVPQIVCPATSYGFNHDCDEYEREAVIGYMGYRFDPISCQLNSQVYIVD
ncbi:metallophosphoesterase [uncultured Shewanella sp.]|uniref:metallophosphoesterase family protein n=1 Tax=uncultured Shewanella sp. TaxID=173975 RepID=UPI00260BDEF5|nr:metallophosphoesterase [uncultured Shewanella sp.]